MQVENRNTNETQHILEVIAEKEESSINITANEIFTSYADLVRIHNGYSQKLTELKNRKLTLEATWAYYLFNKSDCCSRFDVITLVATTIIGVANLCIFVIGLKQLNISAWLPGMCAFILSPACGCWSIIVPSFPCVATTLGEHKSVRREIDQVEMKVTIAAQLIKLTHVFAEFCKEWSQVGQDVESKDVKPLFKKLRKLSNVDNSAIENSVSRAFLRLAPLYLMEKITKQIQDGEIVSSWQHVKQTPSSWGGDDKKFWAKVKMHTPSPNDYIQFFKIKETAQEADPDNWQAWMENKLKAYAAACN